MFLSALSIRNFRNLTEVSVDLSDRFNIFYGGNGSGKTSLLEAIYHLGLARSFKTRTYDHVLQHGSNEFIVFGRIGENPTGVSRCRDGSLRLRISDKDARSAAELAKNFPLQLINPDTYQLITAGSRLRRQFIDQGVFHVEHSFLPLWRKLNHILKQRNSALKMKNITEIERFFGAWDEELVQISETITQYRKQFIRDFCPIFEKLMKRLLQRQDVRLSFYAGWPEEESLLDLLQHSRQKDLFSGHTHYGAHRADLILQTDDGRLVQDVLSRGQLKLIVCAMQLAQAVFLEEKADKKCIFLIDDLPSELDERHRAGLCEILMELETQVFMTGIELRSFNNLLKMPDTRAFHVDTGLIEPLLREKITENT